VISTSGFAIPLRRPKTASLIDRVGRTATEHYKILALLGTGAVVITGGAKVISLLRDAATTSPRKVRGWELHSAWESTGGVLVATDRAEALIPPGVPLGDSTPSRWRKAAWADAEALAAGEDAAVIELIGTARVLELAPQAAIWIEERTRWQLRHLAWLAELTPADAPVLLSAHAVLQDDFDAAFAPERKAKLSEVVVKELDQQVHSAVKEGAKRRDPRERRQARRRTRAVMANVRHGVEDAGPATIGRRWGATSLNGWSADRAALDEFERRILRDDVQLDLEVELPVPFEDRPH
jgi:hypothetical protein